MKSYHPGEDAEGWFAVFVFLIVLVSAVGSAWIVATLLWDWFA